MFSVHASASRLLLTGATVLAGAVLAFLIGARAGSLLDRAMTHTAGATAAMVAR